MDDGANKKMISEPFSSLIVKAKIVVRIKLIIKSIQFFLKELFTDNTFGDFKNIEKVVRKKSTPKTQIV